MVLEKVPSELMFSAFTLSSISASLGAPINPKEAWESFLIITLEMLSKVFNIFRQLKAPEELSFLCSWVRVKEYLLFEFLCAFKENFTI